MTVLVTDGSKDLEEAIRQVLDVFSADLDWTRGVFLKPNSSSRSSRRAAR